LTCFFSGGSSSTVSTSGCPPYRRPAIFLACQPFLHDPGTDSLRRKILRLARSIETWEQTAPSNSHHPHRRCPSSGCFTSRPRPLLRMSLQQFKDHAIASHSGWRSFAGHIFEKPLTRTSRSVVTSFGSSFGPRFRRSSFLFFQVSRSLLRSSARLHRLSESR
jgi:hypothetical protein